MFSLLVILSLITISYVNCTSSGQSIALCDALSDIYGCLPEQWDNGNRKKCQQEDAIMSWVSRGVETDIYTITLGPNEDQPVSQYSPGEIIPLHIRTHKHGMKWRGIMIYAVDSEGNRVGTWELPQESNAWFQVSQDCENTVLHNSAVRKPYHITLNWKAPETAVGVVTFECLLKYGNANVGAFYYPAGTLNGDIKLNENPNPVLPLPWVRSELNQNCIDACANVGKECKVEKMNEIINPELFTQQISSTNLCKLPLLSSCSSLGVTSSTDRYCYYASTNEDCNQQNRNFEETTCEAKSDNPARGQRWCYCEGETTYVPPPPPETTEAVVTESKTVEVSQSKTVSKLQTKTVSDVQTKMDSNGNTVSETVAISQSESVEATVAETISQSIQETKDLSEIRCSTNGECESGVCQSNGICFDTEGISEGVSLRSQLVTFTVLGLGFFNFRYSKSLVTIVVVFALVSGTNAHNWVTSNARASGVATTVTPCPARISSKPNIQVGRDQDFQIEWTIGHKGSTSFFAIIHESNQDKLGLHNDNSLEKYVDQADKSTNLARENKWMKRHRSPNIASDNQQYIESEILPSDPDYIAAPDALPQKPNSKLWRYKTQYLNSDHWYTYDNVNFPWIESLYSYYISMHAPQHWDVTNFQLPGKAGFGRYIVHWVWRGYRDCIEVDLLDHFVDFPYGVPTDTITYTVIPHCFYEDFQQARSRCEEALPSLKAVKKVCSSQDATGCRGINVVPYKYPDSVYEKFRDYPGIPLNTSRWCNTDMGNWPALSTEAQRETMYVSYGVIPRAPTDTEHMYVTSGDPQDPIFYSTCIAKEATRTYEGYDMEETAPETENPWRFINKCISCENRQKNAVDYWPRYDIVDTCINCDDEPIPAVQHFTAYSERSQCKDNGANCGGNDCTKKVTSYTKSNLDIAPEDCSFLIARDDECSDFFWTNEESSCFCLKKNACCMENGCEKDHLGRYTVYRNTFEPDTPDPECNRGRIVDGKCCSVNGEKLDFCTNDNSLDWRKCSEFGPPCSMN